MSNVLSVRRHTLEMGVHDARQRMPVNCSVPVTYGKLMPSVCNVHQRMEQMSHTSAYVGSRHTGVQLKKVV